MYQEHMRSIQKVICSDASHRGQGPKQSFGQREGSRPADRDRHKSTRREKKPASSPLTLERNKVLTGTLGAVSSFLRECPGYSLRGPGEPKEFQPLWVW